MTTWTEKRAHGLNSGNSKLPSREQLRRDRIVAVVALAAVLLLVALSIWLGLMTEGPPTGVRYYWPVGP